MAGTDWGQWAAVGGTILVGGLGMAWRLGRVEQKVEEARQDIADIKESINEEVRHRLWGGPRRQRDLD